MPTGYTAGIVDGKITTFLQFAKLCMRNFGATAHMRDDSLSKEYVPRKVSDYHKEAIEEIRKKIEALKCKSDRELIADEKQYLKECKERNLKSLSERKENRLRLEKILTYARAFTPPTKEHEGIKKFMIEQIISTIEWDCDLKYLDTEFEHFTLKEKSIDAIILRNDKKMGLKKDLEYHLEKYKEEVLSVVKSNEWVELFLNAVNQK